MPFIDFDEHGVCNYCRYYQKIPQHGAEKLMELADCHRGSGTDPDCIVGVSGGRDSVYGLHYIKNVLRLTPIAYTYDWGMVTDLARRNTSRICAKLGIEHIIVSADIIRKRRNICKNVRAWCKRPSLGTIPLFMAGDKQYFYYLKKVKSQVGVDLTFLCENMLERTDFKTGYANVPPFNEDRHHVYTLPLAGKLKMGMFFAKEYLLNPYYINESVGDTMFAFASYYLMSRQYFNLYTYIPWREEDVVSIIQDEYGFERSPDSNTTWRIGDGTAAFYNYIYYTVSGFTENDTFRSNQIREGFIDRSTALEKVRVENEPRFETIAWYLRAINLGIPLEVVLEIINKMPKRWQHVQ